MIGTYITPKLTTNRLILNKGIPEDYLKVNEFDFDTLYTNPDKPEFIRTDKDPIMQQFSGGIDKYYQDKEIKHEFDWIVYKDGDNPIGNIKTTNEDINTLSTEISILVHPDEWKQGFTNEALVKAIDFLFADGYQTIYMKYTADDIKTKRTIDKLGFSFFGVTKGVKKDNGKIVDVYNTIMTKSRWGELKG